MMQRGRGAGGKGEMGQAGGPGGRGRVSGLRLRRSK